MAKYTVFDKNNRASLLARSIVVAGGTLFIFSWVYTFVTKDTTHLTIVELRDINKDYFWNMVRFLIKTGFLFSCFWTIIVEVSERLHSIGPRW